MKILVVTDKKYLNPYTCELMNHMSERLNNGKVVVGISEFWNSDATFDIIHFQWIEELFDWDDYNMEKVVSLLERIDHFKNRGASVVCTIHNLYPHKLLLEQGCEMYMKVFQKTDLFVHLGKISKKIFAEVYGGELVKSKRHVVIPHGLYDSFEKNVDRNSARSYFGINEKDFVLLAFGRIRNFEEERLIFDAFRALKTKRKKVIIPWYNFSNQRLGRLIQKVRLGFTKKVIAKSGYIKKKMVPYYFAASDIVLIPRINILNSGNLFLGFFYEKVVTGPGTGVVGEILKETGNPYFIPGDKRSLSLAINNAKKLAESSNKGHENFLYANERFNWGIISEMHIKEYESIIKT